MKKLVSLVLLALAIVTFSFAPPAFAGDAAKGASIFSANCAMCHGGGGNVINGAKTLKQDKLEQYGMASEEAIINQVTKGKPPMPGFKGRLSDADIENVAAYVLAQAAKGW